VHIMERTNTYNWSLYIWGSFICIKYVLGVFYLH
jgi:hypothetical protein